MQATKRCQRVLSRSEGSERRMQVGGRLNRGVEGETNGEAVGSSHVRRSPAPMTSMVERYPTRTKYGRRSCVSRAKAMEYGRLRLKSPLAPRGARFALAQAGVRP